MYLKKQLYHRLTHIFMVVCFMLGLFPTGHIAMAEDLPRGWHENITLTGRDVGTFTLDSNTVQMFHAEDAVPGDVWEGKITIENKAGGPMEVSLLTISNKLNDASLYNTLDLDIWIGSETVYAGKYGETPDTISDFYVIPAGSSMEMEVRISFPKEAGNNIQGKIMDSTWTFEARYAGRSNESSLYPYRVQYLDKASREPLIPNKQGYAAYGDTVTEYAIDLAGYEPDANKKSITIRSEGNTITFYYQKKGEPATPNESKPPSDTTTDSVKTGEDLTVSNTSSLMYIIIATLCVLCILIVWCRILFAHNRMERRKNE